MKWKRGDDSIYFLCVYLNLLGNIYKNTAVLPLGLRNGEKFA